MNRCWICFLTHLTINGTNICFSITEMSMKIWRIFVFRNHFSYIFTSHDRSCEQNGHGKVTESATIRFCFGGGFRFDFRFPILSEFSQSRYLKNNQMKRQHFRLSWREREKKTTSDDNKFNKKKIISSCSCFSLQSV